MRFERRRARTSGGEIAYVDLGEGRPILLLHGFPTTSDLWRREILLLAGRMRVVAPDLLGYGASDRPVDADLSVGAQAEYVRELAAGLGIDGCAVAGHDIGGGIAQLLALDGFAEALILLDSVCFDAWPAEAVRTLQRATREQETGEFAATAVRRTLELGTTHSERRDEAFLVELVESWASDPPSLFRAARAIDGGALAGREQELGRLDVPTLVVWGEDDPYLPSELAERLGETVPGALVALLPGCSHYVTEDAGPTVDQIVHEFLRLRYLGESHGHAPPGPVPVFLERPSDEELLRYGPEETTPREREAPP